MKVRLETGSDTKGVRFILGGNPEKIDTLKDDEGFFEIDLLLEPYKLAKRLEEAGHWVRRMQIRFPDNDVDLWVESDRIP